MSLLDRYIEQCKAEEVLSNIIEGLIYRPINRSVDTKGNQIIALLQQIVDAHILGFNVDGAVYETGYSGSTTASALLNRGHILSLVDNSITTINGGDITLGMSKCKYAEYNALTSITSGYSDFGSMGELEIVELPNLVSIVGPRSYFNSGLIKRINIKKLNNTGKFYSNTLVSANLIDVEYGASISANCNFLSEWNPSNALLDNSDSLLTDEDRTAGFSNNKQKLLWNIRNHIAANLRTDVGNKTITFQANVKAAILADADTLAAFPANWTIA